MESLSAQEHDTNLLHFRASGHSTARLMGAFAWGQRVTMRIRTKAAVIKGRPSLSRHGLRQASPWIVMLASRQVRGRMVMVLALCGLLAVMLAALTLPAPSSIADLRLNALDPGAPGRRALRAWEVAQLPGSPLAELMVGQSTPATPEGEEAQQRNARAPFLTLGPPAAPFRFGNSALGRNRAAVCLAAAMFYEAGDDPRGQLAVGQVVLNRVRHPAFPSSICGVVAQGSERRTGCQFTFTCDGALARRPSPTAWARAMAHADLMLNGLVFAGVGLATHYHTEDVFPWWSPKLDKIARVGSHLFLRWPGHWGAAAATVSKPREPERWTLLFAGLGSAQAGDAPGNPRIYADLAVAGANVPPRLVAAVTDVRDPPDAQDQIPASRRLLAAAYDEKAQRDESRGLMSGVAPVLGHRLVRVYPTQGVFFLVMAPGTMQASGRRAAELLCGGRAECQVYGWDSVGAMPGGPQVDAAARKGLAFAYVRRAADPRSLPPSANAL